MQNLLAVVSLKNIRNNAEVFSARAGVPLIAVVKDDAYGHGAEQVARALEEKADMFAVSSACEGAALRTSGIAKDVLVLTPPLSKEEIVRISAYNLIATVSSLAALNMMADAVQKYGLRLRAHIAVNTGMNRYGLRPDRIRFACRAAKESGIEIEGVYSHFYAPEDEWARNFQREIFSEAQGIVREYFPRCMRHLAATGGTLAGGELYDGVRIGIGLYGYLPSGFIGAAEVKPAMKIYAYVAQSGKFIGGGAGYGAAEKEYGKLHTLRLGYGDGFFRAGGIGIGNLCMDACVCEGRGDFGARRLVIKNATEYAVKHGTTEYEALVGFGRKAVKVYVE